MHLPGAEYAFWLASLGLGLWNTVMMLRQGLLPRLTALFCYLFVYAVGGIVLLLLTPHLSRHDYSEAFWAGQTALLILSMGIVYSFWKTGLANYHGFHRLCAILLSLTVVAELVVVGFTTVSGQGVAPTAAQWLNAWLLLFSRSVMFVVAGLLWVFLFLLAVLPIRVSRTVRNLALVFFFYAMARVCLDSYAYFRGITSGAGQDYLKLLASFLLQAFWCVVIVRHRADQPEETAPMLAFKATPEDLQRQMDAINLVLLRLTGSSRQR